MIIKDKLIKEYPLTKRIEFPFECYEIIKRRYVVFYHKLINSKNMEFLLEEFNKNTKNNFLKK